MIEKRKASARDGEIGVRVSVACGFFVLFLHDSIIVLWLFLSLFYLSSLMFSVLFQLL